jgi:hypothetical protein
MITGRLCNLYLYVLSAPIYTQSVLIHQSPPFPKKEMRAHTHAHTHTHTHICKSTHKIWARWTPCWHVHCKCYQRMRQPIYNQKEHLTVSHLTDFRFCCLISDAVSILIKSHILYDLFQPCLKGSYLVTECEGLAKHLICFKVWYSVTWCTSCSDTFHIMPCTC